MITTMWSATSVWCWVGSIRNQKYIGTEAAIKAQIAEIKADTKMSAKDKKEALAGLNQALKAPEPPIQFEAISISSKNITTNSPKCWEASSNRLVRASAVMFGFRRYRQRYAGP